MGFTKDFPDDLARGESMHGLVVDILLNKLPKFRLDIVAIQKAGPLIDSKFGIDYFLIQRTGLVYSLQEKCLSAKFAHYDTVTIEYMSDRHQGDEGDFFNCLANLYFVGYGDSSGFKSAYLLYYRGLKAAINSGKLRPTTKEPINGRGDDASSFYAYPMRYVRKYCKECIVWQMEPESGIVGGNTQAIPQLNGSTSEG